MGIVATAARLPLSTGQDEVPSWPVRHLARRLRRALDLAVLVVDDFGSSGYADADRPALSFGPEKVLAEASMLAHVAEGCVADADVDARVRALRDRLAPLVRSTAALADMALNPESAFKRAVPHVLLSGLGSLAPEFDDFAANRCLQVLRHAADQPATVLAERWWLASLWSRLPGAHAAPAPALGFSHEQPLDLRVEAREEAYGLTHRLFYETDLGRRPPEGVLARSRTQVLADVEGLLARYLEHGDYDIVGELLMAWPELRAPWSPAATFAFHVLARAEDEVGLLPCGNVDPARLARLSGSERTRYARATSYHTAFVMGFLCAATLRAGSATADPPPPAPGAWRRLRELIDEDDTSHWIGAFDALPETEREPLVPLLRDLALAQALRRRDLVRVAEVVRTAAAVGLSTSSLELAAADRLWALQRALEISSG